MPGDPGARAIGIPLQGVPRDRRETERDLTRTRLVRVEVLVPTVGTGNEFVAEAEYPDLASFQKERDEFQSDAEASQVFRSSSEHVVEGSARSELDETAPQLA